jgi:hypothetical protein
VHDLYSEQEAWLESKLEMAHKDGARHVVIFQHHSWFLNSADEPDQYFNIPSVRRAKYRALFHKFGVKYAFCGHYHRNKIARDGDLEVVTTSAVGKPLAGESGLRIVIVRDSGIEHRFYNLGEIPNQIDLNRKLPEGRSSK